MDFFMIYFVGMIIAQIAAGLNVSQKRYGWATYWALNAIAMAMQVCRTT